MTNPRCMPDKPIRLPAWPMNVALARFAGNHVSSNPECLTWRTMLRLQSCGWRGRPPMQLVPAKPEVDGIAGVPHQHLRRVHRGNAVVRGVLREPRQECGARPHRIPQVAVHDDFGLEAGNVYIQLALAARVDSQ